MKKKEWKEAVESMKEAGEEIMKERGGNFSFGEWSGESEKEMVEAVTGLDFDSLSSEEIDELCDAFLGF